MTPETEVVTPAITVTNVATHRVHDLKTGCFAHPARKDAESDV